MSSDNIRILITGDLCPHNRIERLVLNNDLDSVLNDFADVFRGNDLNITDLECPLTDSVSARPKIGPHQKAHPDCIRILQHAGIGLAAMANNHIIDFGDEGAEQTIELCREHGIATVGIGTNAEEAARPYSFMARGKRIAIMNFADNEFLSTPAGQIRCNAIDTVKCFYDVKAARHDHDYVIVIVHAGNEFYELPSPRTKKLYRYFADLGADAVIAHHTHAFSGYEVYNSKPIFYGLGNFIYDWPGKINGRWNQGYAVRLCLNDKIDFEIIPLRQCNEKPGVFHPDDEEAREFNKELARLNLIIGNDDLLEEEFRKYCASVDPMYDAFIEPYFGKIITALRKRGLFPKLMSGRKRLLLLNIIRCESHRDVLLRMLKEYE